MDEVYTVFRSSLSEVLDLHRLVEIIPGRFYLGTYSAHRHHPETNSLHFFHYDTNDESANKPKNVGTKYVYEPLNLRYLAEYVRFVNDKMYSRQFESKTIVHYITDSFQNYNNAALLIGAYAIAVKQMNPRTIYTMLKDNGYHIDEHLITIGYGRRSVGLYDCLCVVYKAIKYKLVDFNDFSGQMYDVSRDLTWIVPDRFIAFRGPVEEYSDRRNDLQYYVKYFQKNNIKTVIRLNCMEYNSSWFSNADIEHVDLYFGDGTAPSDAILQTFLRISEQAPGAIAVHCRAGLGRTGTLIAAYLMQHFRMTAREAVAWTRICRPGAITGPQQSFLMDKEYTLWTKGDALRREKYGNAAKITYCTRGIYSVDSRSKSTAINDWNAMKC